MLNDFFQTTLSEKYFIKTLSFFERIEFAY